MQDAVFTAEGIPPSGRDCVKLGFRSLVVNVCKIIATLERRAFDLFDVFWNSDALHGKAVIKCKFTDARNFWICGNDTVTASHHQHARFSIYNAVAFAEEIAASADVIVQTLDNVKRQLERLTE